MSRAPASVASVKTVFRSRPVLAALSLLVIAVVPELTPMLARFRVLSAPEVRAAASATNILGSVESRTDEKLRPVMSAMKAALEEIGYVQTESRVKPIEAVLTFRGKDDAWISVKLKEFPEFTNIKIRCGLTGNDALSRQILQRVYTRL